MFFNSTIVEYMHVKYTHSQKYLPKASLNDHLSAFDPTRGFATICYTITAAVVLCTLIHVCMYVCVCV